VSKGVYIRVKDEATDRLVDAAACAKGWKFGGDDPECGVTYDDVAYPAFTCFIEGGYKLYQCDDRPADYACLTVNSNTKLGQLIKLIPDATPPIYVGNDEVEFHDGYIQVGCQSVSDAKLKAIAERQLDIEIDLEEGE
jgi:hypothetical protein